MAPPRPPLTILYLPIVNWSAKYFPSDDTLKDKDEDKDKDKDKDKRPPLPVFAVFRLSNGPQNIPPLLAVTSNVFSQAGSPGAFPDNSLIL